MARKHRVPSPLPVLVLGLATVACRVLQPTPPEELGLWSDAAAAVAEPKLATLCEEFWEDTLRADPIRATFLGDPRYHGEMPPNSDRARTARIERLEEMLGRVERIDSEDLSGEDRLTRDLLAEGIALEIERLSIDLKAWTIDPVRGPILMIQNLIDVQPVETERQRRQLVERWKSVTGYLRVASFNLKSMANRGLVSSETPIRKNLEQLRTFLETPPMDSPLVGIATGGGEWVALPPGGNLAQLAHEHLGDARLQRDLRRLNLHLEDEDRVARGTKVLLPGTGDPLPVEVRGRFLHDVLTAVEDHVYPAVAAYRDTLEGALLPRARSDERPGLVHVPGGEGAYRAMIRRHTTLPPEECDPRAIHEFGLGEVARIRAEMSELGQRVFSTGDVAEIQERLRTDPQMHFQTREEVRSKAESALRRAQRRMARFFGILPRARCEVVPVPAHAERDSTIAWYEPPAADGGRAGRYYVNTSEPQTRPRYEAEVLAYHEAIPGHHLQIAIAQELEDLPLFRRHEGSTAFVEGWALYTERLCDEMGLYSSDLDRLGMLSFDAWRAARLVVDTGLHAFGWSREQAIDYLFENTLLARNNVENEVDRYVAWPGQALAYKLGQRELIALRDEARAALGPRFDYPAFHDAVLSHGAVSLPVLRGTVRRWIRSQGGAVPVEASVGEDR